MNVYGAYVLVAFVSSLASFFIALVGLKAFTHISDGGMFAVALMVAAPMAMAVGVSYFIHQTQRYSPPQPPRLPPDDGYGEGAFTPIRRG